MNYEQIFSDWAKGIPLDYIKPEQRRALPLIVLGAASEEQLDAAGTAFVQGIKTAATFTSRAASGPIEKARAGEFSIPWVLSDGSPDRMGDVISSDGWKLENYRKNNVVLWGHGGGGVLDGDEPIGRAENVRAEKGRLIADIRFAVDESDRAARKFRLANSGYIKAGSVGFRPLKVERVEDEDERKRLGLGRFGVLYKEQELLEFSLVAVPANAHALQQSVKLGEIRSDDADWLVAECSNRTFTERDLERVARRSIAALEPPKPEPPDTKLIARTLEHDENLRKLLDILKPKDGKEVTADARFMMEAILALRNQLAEIAEERKALAKESAEMNHAIAAALVMHSKATTDLGSCLGTLRAQPAPPVEPARGNGRDDGAILHALYDLLKAKR